MNIGTEREGGGDTRDMPVLWTARKYSFIDTLTGAITKHLGLEDLTKVLSTQAWVLSPRE